MILVLDASTLINLANGEVLDTVLNIPDVEYHVSTVVRQESRTVARAIDDAVAARRLSLVDDTLISIVSFAEIKERYNLDDGETECLLAAQAMDCWVACDDAAGRAAVGAVLGGARLKGSIGLLKMAITAGLITSGEAFTAYTLMRNRGGYLPVLQATDF